jgi:hypothetical protein
VTRAVSASPSMRCLSGGAKHTVADANQIYVTPPSRNDADVAGQPPFRMA